MRLFISAFLACTFLLGTVNLINAQGKLGKAGKVFSVEEANQLFGEVKAKKTINTIYLKRLLKKANHYVRFKLKKGMLSVLDDNINMEAWNKRFPSNVTLTDDSPEHIYSVETITELIELGGSELTTIEEREEVLTVTNGAYTMEFAIACPPICPN